MNCYIIGYDLRGERDYDTLHKAIRSYEAWAHILESQWVIETNDGAIEVRDHLLNFMDDNDGLFVATLIGEVAWEKLLSEGMGVKWLHGNLPNEY